MAALEHIARYRIEKILGKGAAGTVYKAYDPVLKQTVAIKVIHKQLLEQDESGEQLTRFRNEVLAGRRLKHTHIVSIYEYGEEGDNAYIIMEYIAGKQLKDFLDEKYAFDLPAIQKIMLQLLAALSYAHQQNIVHRDIKPANIMVMPDWQVLVADFGIAKIESAGMTQTGVIMGTPNYMSPEQCLGGHIDSRADIFSAGVIFYHLLTGKRPFESDTLMATLQQVLKLTPPNPSTLNKALDPALDTVVARALAKNPGERFQNAEDFSAAIVQAMSASHQHASVTDATLLDTETAERQSSSNNGPSAARKTRRYQIKISWFITLGLLVISGMVLLNKRAQYQKLDGILANYHCAGLEKTFKPWGRINLAGYLPETELIRLKTDLTQNLPGSEIDTHQIKTIKAALCPVFELKSLLSGKEPIALQTGKIDHRFTQDDYLELTAGVPGFDGYLYVDYFQLDGQVLHLYPIPGSPNKLIKANSSIRLGQSGQDKRWQIAPPFGTEIITAIYSAVPLFNGARQDNELIASYLRDLKSAMQAANGAITAENLAIETSPD